jgi:predicted transcriptional regulator
MTRPRVNKLSHRERQIMDIIYRAGQATAQKVLDHMPDPPGNATVRKLMKILEDKGHLKHEKQGAQFVYAPTVPAAKARVSACSHLLDTFFEGSTVNAMLALMKRSGAELSAKDREKIVKLIEKSKSEGA